MSRVLCLCLLALSLALPPALASAADLVFHNHSAKPVSVTLISPCGQEELILVQVASGKPTSYDLPVCKKNGAKPKSVHMAVFDQRHTMPGFIAMSIAAKAYVRLPALVSIQRQDCKECDTRYKLNWMPQPKQ
ncbi:MAG: hypothetical protein KQH53_17670 [Desulfarculaceae bacterium]|nr:hypothetical protein [Desulfarculaceae bacterium]